MTAIITDKIKRELTQHLFDELEGTRIGDSDNYYFIGVGRSQQYNPVANNDIPSTPQNTDREERLMRYNLQSVKAVEAQSFVIPMYEWTSNTQYTSYNDNVAGQPATSYYVRTVDNNVYLCVRTGKNTNGVVQVSTIKPSHTDTSIPIQSDGYAWKFLYTITTANANSFLTTEFMPVKFVDSAVSTDPEFSQYSVQNAAVAGQIIGYRVTNAGGPYTGAPAITVSGNGSGATAYAVLNASGGVAAIEVDSDGSGDLVSGMGSDYDYATVSISGTKLVSGGTAATAVPIFGPKNGLGADAREDLRSTSLMFNIKPDGTEDGTWITGNDYRQVGIFKNITIPDSAELFTGTAGTCLQRLTLTTLPGINAINYENDVEMTGATSGAKGWLDYYDDSNTLWFHQDEYTGFTPFEDGENVTVEGYTASTLTIDSSFTTPDFDKFSGKLLYIDNRATATTRDVGQTEDIKLVIKL